MFKVNLKTKLILLSIFLLGGFLRLYDINWDQGFHLHPDERAIILKVVELDFPQSISQFLSTNSPWNPHFFAYGSFPFYLLRVSGDFLSIYNVYFGKYDMINIVGRMISGFADLVTLLVIFFIGKKIASTKIGILATFFYAISVLPIQLSHFYAVDTLLTLFISLTLYHLICFYEKPTKIRALVIGVCIGLAIATKISALVLLVAVGTALAIDFFLLFIKNPHRPKVWVPRLPRFFVHLLVYALIIGVVAACTFALFEPYAIIDFQEFWTQNMQQSEMTHNAFIFPYTLQYVGKIPYLYEAKNIFFFGLGPLLAMLSFGGMVLFSIRIFHKVEKWQKEIILLSFFVVYIFVVGRFAVGFMRYMLPIYPLLALFAAIFTEKYVSFIKLQGQVRTIILGYLLVLLLIWPMSYMHIYTKNNTRYDASTWINEHISTGKTIAIEHWDDGLPLFGHERYNILTLALYEPDTSMKWDTLNAQLRQTDYIIIASNRLYTPLQKLTNCAVLPVYKCYTRTAQYYQKLFDGKLGFQKVAEFTDYPTIPFLDLPFNDQGADESFTVYDHPKVMIFQKTAQLATYN